MAAVVEPAPEELLEEVERVLIPARRITSRLLEIQDGLYDMNLNLLETDEREFANERLISNHTLDIFDNTNRAIY